MEIIWPAILPKILILALAFLLSLPGNVPGEHVDNEPFWLTDGQKVHFALDYVNQDQCLGHPGRPKVLSNSIRFHLRRGYSCEGLLICYPGQLDGANKANGIFTPINLRVNNARNNSVGKDCEAFRHRFCQGIGDEAICLPGGAGSVPWHGIKLWTQNSRIRLKLSIGHIVFQFIHGQHFLLELGRMENLYTIARVPRRRYLPLRRDSRLRSAFLNNARRGALLSRYAGLWMLATDILPTEADQKLHLFVNRGCNCTMHAWFNRPSTTLLPEKPPTTIGTKACPVLRTDTFIELGELEENVQFVLRMLGDPRGKYFKLSVLDRDGEDLMDMAIGEDNLAVFGPLTVDGEWNWPSFRMGDWTKHYGRERLLEVHFHSFYYEIAIADEDDYPGSTLNMLWPREWWKKLPFGRIAQLHLEGDVSLVADTLKMAGHLMAFSITPIATRLEKAVSNGTEIIIRGRLKANASWLSVQLLHDAPEWHFYMGATLMEMHVDFKNDSVQLSVQLSSKNTTVQFSSYNGMEWHRNVPITDNPFPQEGGFECRIWVIEKALASAEEKPRVEYQVRVNGKQLPPFLGQLPAWTLNWVRLDGDMELLEQAPAIHYGAFHGDGPELFKHQLEHLLFFGDQFCLEAFLLSSRSSSPRKGFEVNLFREANEFNKDIGDTVLQLNFSFPGEISPEGSLSLNSYEQREGSWGQAERHDSPLGQTGLKIALYFRVARKEIQMKINGIDLKYKHRLPPWAVNWMMVTGDVDEVKFGTDSALCRVGQRPLPKNILQIDPNKPLAPGQTIVVQGLITNASDSFRLSINFFHEALAWHPIIGQTVFQANFSKQEVSFNTFVNGSWQFDSSSVEHRHSIEPPFSEEQPFELIVQIKPGHFLVQCGKMEPMEYPHRMPVWAVQYVVVNSENGKLAKFPWNEQAEMIAIRSGQPD